MLGTLLYLIYASDLPISGGITTETFADDTAILASHEDPVETSKILQDGLNHISDSLKRWRIKANDVKSVNFTFTVKRGTCPLVKLNSLDIPQTDYVRYVYLCLRLDK